jgi:hypothetical protein
MHRTGQEVLHVIELDRAITGAQSTGKEGRPV